MNLLIFTKKKWDKENFKNFRYNKSVYKRLNISLIKKKKPNFIFFIHWSKFIPSKVYEKYNCIQFHCSDLPRFRGGSPVQNQIIRGIKNTKLTAFCVDKKIDAGKIYLKRKLSLNGNASEIFKRIEKKSLSMIKTIIKQKIQPYHQKGKKSHFKRRSEADSFITKKITNLSNLYDFIRMLDADGYPRAKLKFGNFIYEFHEVKFNSKVIHGKFSLKKK